MAVKSSVLGGVSLSGVEAKKFQRQVVYGRPKKAAVDSAIRGSVLLQELERSGCVVLRARKST